MKTKNKFLLTSSALMLGTLVANGPAFADEVQPATQPEPAKPAETTQASTEGSYVATQDTTKLDKLAEEVQASGGNVEKGEAKTEYVLTQETADKLNAEKQKELDSKAEEVQKQVDNYNNSLKAYNDKKTELKDETPIEEKNGDALYGHVDESKRGSLDYYKSFELVAENRNNDIDTVTKPIGWYDDTKFENVSANAVTETASDGRTQHVISKIEKGQQFWLRNVGETKEHGQIDALVTIAETPENLGDDTIRHDVEFLHGDSNTWDIHVYNVKWFNFHVDFKDKSGNDVTLANATVVTDVDWNQSFSIDYNRTQFKNVIPKDSGLVELPNGVVHHDNPAINEGFDNVNAIPKGSYVSSGIGNRMTVHIGTSYATTGTSTEEYTRIIKEGDGSGAGYGVFGGGTALRVTIKPQALAMGYDTVKYEVIGLKPEKAIEKTADSENIDGATIDLNSTFVYHLKGALVLGDRKEALTDYAFSDDYDEKGDEYQNKYTAKLVKDVTLKDGTVLSAGTDVTKFTTAIAEDGKITISFKEEFLTTVADASVFQSDVYLEFKRIAVGTFENTYVNRINNVDHKSNTVKSTTPDPQKPEPQKPVTPTPTPTPEPEQPKQELPNTGAEDLTLLPVLGLVALGSAGYLVLRKKKVA